MAWHAVIETASSELLRACYGDAPAYDSATETLLTDVAPPAGGAYVQSKSSNQVHKWNGSGWDLSDKTLVTLQLQKITRLGAEFTDYMLSRYSITTQASFSLLYAEAGTQGLTNRTALIQQGLDWLHTALQEFYAKQGAVLAATDSAGVDAVALDLAALDAADPGILLQAAEGIVD